MSEETAQKETHEIPGVDLREDQGGLHLVFPDEVVQRYREGAKELEQMKEEILGEHGSIEAWVLSLFPCLREQK